MFKRISTSVLVVFLLGLSCLGQVKQDVKGSMVLIPAGKFLMGKDTEKASSVSPAHKVKLDAFYMDKYEVTNGEYLKFCKETDHKLPYFWGTEIFKSGENFLDYPVVGVNWNDAKKYAEWAGKRLPTEAEWEYAARGGLEGVDYPYGNEYTGKKFEQDPTGWQNFIEPVGKNEPNGYGLYDMSGNVWEWVADYFSRDYYKVSESDNPRGPEIESSRGIRGGSWVSGPGCKKVYYRKGLPGNWYDFAVGFRCAKDVEE
jgi:iron(II)-dependent oxidoreductase